MSHDPRYFISASITRSAMMEDPGLKICEYNGEYIIYEVGGVFDMFTEVKKGSRLLKLQNKNIQEYGSLDEIKKVLEESKTISVEALRIPNFQEILNDSSVSESEGLLLEEGIPAEK